MPQEDAGSSGPSGGMSNSVASSSRGRSNPEETSSAETTTTTENYSSTGVSTTTVRQIEEGNAANYNNVSGEVAPTMQASPSNDPPGNHANDATTNHSEPAMNESQETAAGDNDEEDGEDESDAYEEWDDDNYEEADYEEDGYDDDPEANNDEEDDFDDDDDEEEEDDDDDDDDDDDEGNDRQTQRMPFPFGMMMPPPPPDMDSAQMGSAMMSAFMSAMMSSDDVSPADVMMAMQAAAESMGLFDDEEDEEPDTSLKCPLCTYKHHQCDPKGPCMTKFHCSHDARVVYTENMQCPICMDLPKEQPMVSMPCGHVICREDFQSLGGEIKILNQEQLDRQREKEERAREGEVERNRRRNGGDNDSTSRRPNFPSGPPDRLFSAIQQHFGPPTQSTSGNNEDGSSNNSEEEDFSDLPPLEQPDGRLVTDQEADMGDQGTNNARAEERASNRNSESSGEQAASSSGNQSNNARESNNPHVRGFAMGGISGNGLPPFLRMLQEMSENGAHSISFGNGMRMRMGVVNMDNVNSAMREASDRNNENQDTNDIAGTNNQEANGAGSNNDVDEDDDESAGMPPLLHGDDSSSDSELDDLPPLSNTSGEEVAEAEGRAQAVSSANAADTEEPPRNKDRRDEPLLVETVSDSDSD